MRAWPIIWTRTRTLICLHAGTGVGEADPLSYRVVWGLSAALSLVVHMMGWTIESGAQYRAGGIYSTILNLRHLSDHYTIDCRRTMIDSHRSTDQI